MNDKKLLVTIEHGQDVYRCELRDLESNGIGCQWFLNGRPVYGAPRVRSRHPTVEEKHRAVLVATAA